MKFKLSSNEYYVSFENTRGIYSMVLDNGITVMSIRDYAFMLRGTVEATRNELAFNSNDVADFVFINTNVDDDDNVLLGVQYHNTVDETNEYFAIIGCKKDSYVTSDEMFEYLLNQ